VKLKNSFLQSKLWADFKSHVGNEVVVVDGFFLYKKKLPLGLKVGYMPRVSLSSLLRKDIISKCKDQNLTYLRIDPIDLKREEFDLLKKLKEKKVFFKTSYPIQLPRTVVIDLKKSELDLLAQMKQKNRYNIKVAEKKGVKVKIDAKFTSFNVFLDLYLQTIRRQKYIGRNTEYITKLFNVAKKNNAVKIATAYYKNEPLASWFLLLYEDHIYYLYGGSSSNYRNVMPTYKLLWDIVRWGKKHKYNYFDLYGIKDDENSGFSRFKVGFVEKDQSQIIEYSKTIDIVYRPLIYNILRIIEKLRKLIFQVYKIRQ
jgi:lipid II:glycine glycyltransferase (peptidoglycan interpeptide bridge formation enzyme)